MAKPLNPYQGPAPAAMAQMGQGMAEVGANIGRTLQRGYESMGQGIAGGIKAAADAYKQYKDTQSEVKASEKSYETMKSFLPEEVRNKFDQEIESMNKSDTTSLRDKAAFWNNAKSFIGSSVGQAFQMQKQKQELDARAGLQAAGDAAQNWRTLEQINAQSRQPWERAAAESMFGGGGGGSNSFMPQSLTLGSGQPQASQQPSLPAQINTQFRRKGN